MKDIPMATINAPNYLMVCLCDDEHKSLSFDYNFFHCDHHNAVRLVDLVKHGVSLGLIAYQDGDEIKKLDEKKLKELLNK